MAHTPATPPPLAPAPAKRSAAAVLGLPPMLAVAFLASFALHGLLLGVDFVPPPPKPANDRDRGLEVVLVNARHARAPEKAEALAQANLDGGGASEQDVRPKSPLPPQETRRDGDALVEAKKRAPERETVKQAVLTKPKAEAKVAKAAPPKVEQPPIEEEIPSGLDLLDSAKAMARMEAQIDRQLEEYAKRPRRKFIGARTREYRFAQYVEDWRLKIERIGTLNYPDAARGRLYGSLLLTVVIRADGSVERVQVERSSGEKVLDEAAVRIVELAAPFAAFPPGIRKDWDSVTISRTWTFTNQNRVRAD